MPYLKEIVLILVFAIIIVANVYDLTVDYREGASDWHIYQEALLVLLSATAITYLLANAVRQRREMNQLRRDLAKGGDDAELADESLRETRKAMGELIQTQFKKWQLTPSEQEVALLLLKGLSFKEIAAVRDTLEKTVRQQASSIYRKAGVSGRASFSAWFIEDIL